MKKTRYIKATRNIYWPDETDNYGRHKYTRYSKFDPDCRLLTETPIKNERIHTCPHCKTVSPYERENKKHQCLFCGKDFETL